MKYQHQIVLKPGSLAEGVSPILLAPIIVTDDVDNLEVIEETIDEDEDPEDVPTEDLWTTALAQDTFEAEILTLLDQGAQHSKKIPLAECSNVDGHLYFRNRRYVPDFEPLHTRLIRVNHDTLAAGHPGRGKTFGLVTRQFWWPKMFRTIKKYVRNCRSCYRAKARRHAYQGWL